MKQFCMKIDLISQGRENVVFLPSNMAAMTSHEDALYPHQLLVDTIHCLYTHYARAKQLYFLQGLASHTDSQTDKGGD